MNLSPLLSDDSLCAEGLYVDSLACSNLSVGEGRHYWLVEVNGGRIQHAYDSLQGVQSLTQEVYRMLQVTGVLLRSASCGKPSLRNPKLDQMAGKVETVQRRSQAIRVASRSRTCKMRKQLVKSMSNLSVAPTKFSFFSKHLEEKEGLGENGLRSLRRATFRRHNALVGGRGGKTPQAGKAKGCTKGKARTRNTSKALPIGSVTLKDDVVCIESPSSDMTRRRKKMVHQSDAVPGDLAGVETPLQKALHPRGTETVESTGPLGIASDPISDTFTQVVAPVASPPREKKRSFTQAELDEISPNQGTTEDDLRRNQGPPKMSPGASTITES